MRLGMVLQSDDAETVWNVFRLGVFARAQGDAVKVFLLGKGVECEGLDNAEFAVKQQMQDFVQEGGEILACGTCLNLRKSEGSEICPVASMSDLYAIVRDSDRLLSF